MDQHAAIYSLFWFCEARYPRDQHPQDLISRYGCPRSEAAAVLCSWDRSPPPGAAPGSHGTAHEVRSPSNHAGLHSPAQPSGDQLQQYRPPKNQTHLFCYSFAVLPRFSLKPTKEGLKAVLQPFLQAAHWPHGNTYSFRLQM